MLSFSKGFNNQNSTVNNNYSKMGRVSPEEIIQKRFENNMTNMKTPKPTEEVKPQVEQKNMGAGLYNKLSAFSHMNNNKK